MKSKRSIMLNLAAISAALAGGCCSAAIEVKDSGTQFAAEAVKPYIESGELPGVISIFCHGDMQETVCMGWANVEEKRPVTLDSMFMQCSQTKGFCGVTIAILVEEGKISLDDPVSKYLPEFKELKVYSKDQDGKQIVVPAKNELTIRMVMNHTGGFPFEIPSKHKKGWPGVSLRETAKEAASIPLQFEPGTKALYSNTGIDIGAAVIEVVTGKGWDEFIKERVFDPLGMKDSTFNPTDEQLARSMSIYEVKKGQKAEFRSHSSWMPLPHNGPNVYPSAGAGLWTTARDQVKFYRMLMNLGMGDNGVRILKEETVLNLLATNSRPAGLGNYSLGLNADKEKGVMGHGGAWGTNCAVNWKKKQLELKVVQLWGNPRPWDKALWDAASKFFKETMDKADIEAYTGRLQ